MITGPLFSYFGSKWTIATSYPAPMHRTIVEPFAGSAGYALRYASREVILVERDPVVASVWRFLLGARRSDVLDLPDLADDQTVDDVDVPAGARALMGFWMNRGHTHPAKRASRWMRVYGTSTHERSFWGPAARERIADALADVAHWYLIEGDYSAAPSMRATWFVDPPYGVERSSKYRGGGTVDRRPVGDRYRCKARDLDFAELGAWCRSLDGQVIVCEGLGAKWLPFRRLGRASSKRPGAMDEAVWFSGDGQLALDGYSR